MAHAAEYHHWHELPLYRRLLRFVLVSILIVTAVMMIQTVVMYLAIPRASRATHHARAAAAAAGEAPVAAPGIVTTRERAISSPPGTCDTMVGSRAPSAS